MHLTYPKFYELKESSDELLNQLITNKDSLRTLRNELFKLYLALKNDLGIYSIQVPSEIIDYSSPIDVIELKNIQEKAKSK